MQRTLIGKDRCRRQGQGVQVAEPGKIEKLKHGTLDLETNLPHPFGLAFAFRFIIHSHTAPVIF